MSWCERRAQCNWCPEHIEAGEAMVRVFFWNKGTEEHKGFNTKKYYHPQCWLDQGLDYLKQNPYVPYKRSRVLAITPEQKKLRNILLRRKCSIEQRRRVVLEGKPNNALLARLDRQVADLMVEIAPLGGIPKRWLDINQIT